MSNGNHADALQRIDPIRLTVLLEKSGWKLAGGRRGIYNRLEPPGSVGIRESLIVPLDRNAPDFRYQLQAALDVLRSPRFFEEWTRVIAPRLAAIPTDRFRFHRESEAPTGLIPWLQGEELIKSARLSFSAGAKSHVEHSPYFGNRLSHFARRYLDAVLMGQTGVGSYIVTAFVPVGQPVSLRGGSSANTIGFEGIDVVDSRKLTASVVSSFEATFEALDHYKSTGSFSGFDEGIDRGISYEMTVALAGIASGSEGADITVEWDPASSDIDLPSTSHFELHPDDVPGLQSASTRLVTAEPPRITTVVGRVHLLTKKQMGGIGVVGIETFGGHPRKFRVRMESSDYQQAVQAHRDDKVVRVTGNLSREGNLNWLYDARLEEIVGPIENFMAWDEPEVPSVTDSLFLVEEDPTIRQREIGE